MKNNIPDKDFYGKGTAPMGGAEMLKVNGQWYEKTSLDYIKSQSKPKQVTEDKSDDYKNDQRERLTLLKSNRARLQKQIDDMTKVINYIEADLKN